jgi:hypothetical protein
MTPEQIEIELFKREENKKTDTLNDFIVSSWAYKLGRIVYDETQKRDIYQGGTRKDVIKLLQRRGFVVDEDTTNKKLADIIIRYGEL